MGTWPSSALCQPKPSRRAAVQRRGRVTKRVQFKSLPSSSSRWKSTTTHHASGYWDLLQVAGISASLNPRALRENHRRQVAEEGSLDRADDSVTITPQQLLAQPSRGLKRFASHGGPDLSDIKRHPNNNPSRLLKPKKPKSRRSEAYGTEFMRLLISKEVHSSWISIRTENHKSIQRELAKRRRSLSPTKFDEDDFQSFLSANDDAQEKAQVMSDILPIIQGPKRPLSTRERACCDFAPLLSGSLVIPEPDLFDGALPTGQNADIREALGELVVPSHGHRSPFLPNFFAEFKAPDSSDFLAIHQIAYDGAFGARAIHHLRAYGADESFDGNASTLTALYHCGNLQIFAHHIEEPVNPDEPVRYYCTSVGEWKMTDDIYACRAGIRAFRNARDWAREVRESSLAEANERVESLTPRERRWKMGETVWRTETALQEINFVDEG